MANSANNNHSASNPPTWTLGEFIGKGNCNHVYTGTYVNPKTGVKQEIAVKRTIAKKSQFLEKEFRILSAFSDRPDIADCYSGEITTEEDGRTFYNLLMEYFPEGTLEDLIRESDSQGLPEEEVKAYTRMILKALICLHKRGYVHCFLKPGSILVFPEKDGSHRLKLANFKFAGEPKPSPVARPVGSEKARLDTWSLGSTVLMMVTGDLTSAFENPNEPEDYMGDREGRDFIRKCFQRSNPRKCWSAQMLLDHPYLNPPTATQKLISGFVVPLHKVFRAFRRRLHKFFVWAAMKTKEEYC